MRLPVLRVGRWTVRPAVIPGQRLRADWKQYKSAKLNRRYVVLQIGALYVNASSAMEGRDMSNGRRTLGLLLHVLLDATAVKLLWFWHVSRIFGLMPLSWWDALCVSFFVAYMKYDYADDSSQHSEESKDRRVTRWWVIPVATIVVGYVLFLLSNAVN